MIATAFVTTAIVTNSIVRNVDSRLERCEPSSSMSRFVGYPENARHDVYCLNDKFWAKEVDFSCASPWNSDRGQLKAGTLISRRHIIFAKHFPIQTGARIVFVGMDGGICPCRLVSSKEIGKCDIMIGALDYEVTPNIRPARILPPDYAKWIGDGDGLPTVTLSQRETAYVNELNPILDHTVVRWMSSRVPNDAKRVKFQRKIIVGDSGNPVFLIVDNEPILLYCLTTGGAGGGPAIHRYRFEIQRAMDELCPGYKLESFDFSKLVEAKQ